MLNQFIHSFKIYESYTQIFSFSRLSECIYSLMILILGCCDKFILKARYNVIGNKMKSTNKKSND